MTGLRSDTHLLGRLPFIAPIAVFVAIGVVLATGLTLNPREIPSPLIGKPVPQFALPPVQGRTLGLASADLRGEVSLDYKDRPVDAAKWLDDLGNPYTRTGADVDGRVSIDWGVYGVPETFVVDRDGRIAYKHIGPVTPEIFDKTLRPLIEKLRR